MAFIEAFPGPGNNQDKNRTTAGGENGEDLRTGRTTMEDMDTSHMKDEWDGEGTSNLSFDEDGQEKVTNNKDADDRGEYPAR
ncbi:MAG TPA: hypothetical protein VM012_00660 [Flavitalea sp.]|nr:hypothetical protein [Flavitalea sp.]